MHPIPQRLKRENWLAMNVGDQISNTTRGRKEERKE